MSSKEKGSWPSFLRPWQPAYSTIAMIPSKLVIVPSPRHWRSYSTLGIGQIWKRNLNSTAEDAEYVSQDTYFNLTYTQEARATPKQVSQRMLCCSSQYRFMEQTFRCTWTISIHHHTYSRLWKLKIYMLVELCILTEQVFQKIWSLTRKWQEESKTADSLMGSFVSSGLIEMLSWCYLQLTLPIM